MKAENWSFYWPCEQCDHLCLHNVSETPGQPLVFGRCSRCSALVEVGTQHRASRRD